MGRNLSQQSALDEKPQIVVNGGERNGWNVPSHRGVNTLRGMVAVGSHDCLIDHLTLVGDRQAVLQGQFTKLLMRVAHSYRTIVIIKQMLCLSSELLRGLQEGWPKETIKRQTV